MAPRRVTLALALSLLPGCRFFEHPRLILLVTVDTLRADHVGAYGTSRLTPHLDRLAADSQVFEAAYAPASFTLPSLGALLTSRYPEEIGVDGNSAVLAKDATTLASWLKARGFRTGAVVSNYVLRRSSGFDAGFERYDATFPQREAVRPVPERVAPETTTAALGLLDALEVDGRRVFLWVHYQDPHGPYAPPDALRARYLPAELAAPDARRELPVAATQSGAGAIPKYQFLGGRRDPAFYRAGYKGEVAYVDQAIGALLDGVASRGLMETATIVFAADHGEGLGEDDYWFSHGERLTDPLVHVPLFVRVPGRPPARRAEAASLLDVFPTLAALLGAGPPGVARGRDLLRPEAPRQPSSLYMSTLKVSPTPRLGLISRGYKYLATISDGPAKEQLFRLGDEGRDLGAEQPDALATLRAELAAARKSLRKVGSTQQALSPEEIEKLDSLGYTLAK